VFYAALFIPSAPVMNFEWAAGIGALVILSGILVRCITIGLVYIVRGGLKRNIHAQDLVTDGIYQICRNPMYLGNILLLLGFGIFADSLLFLLLFFPLFCLFYYAIIKAEEDFLINKFGDQYIKYKESTNALIPNLTRINDAFAGRSLNYSTIIKKEYNSLALYFTGIIGLLYYKSLISLNAFVISAVILAIVYLIIRTLKKKKKL
jgi:protein-S-isoprenylcysteine O-methyltransferase Ste14